MDKRSYGEFIPDLRAFYDQNAPARDKHEKQLWKIEERQQFLSLLQAEQKQILLEIGAGTGQDSQFFQMQGLSVTATDLSSEMVKRCQQKGLTAYVMDFLNLRFPEGSFDAVYALNCLLHVPKRDLPNVLQGIRHLLKPDGLFYLGVYGGHEFEGIWKEDHQEPKRFFSFFTDDQIRQVVQEFFKLTYFKAVLLGEKTDLHFQSMVLRKPSDARDVTFPQFPRRSD